MVTLQGAVQKCSKIAVQGAVQAAVQDLLCSGVLS